MGIARHEAVAFRLGFCSSRAPDQNPQTQLKRKLGSPLQTLNLSGRADTSRRVTRENDGSTAVAVDPKRFYSQII